MYNFPVIDRANLRNILKEYKLSATGMIASNDTKKLGQLSGVDIIIVGSITPLSTKYDVIVKAISTDTAVNIGTWNVEIERSPEFAGLWEGNLGTHYPDDPERGHRQTSMDLEIELTSIDVVEDELIANLTFRNRSGTKQGIALKAQHSDGIADFWKFMPHSEGYMSDSNGNRYPFTSASGILWARTSDEFKMIKPSKSVSLSLRFRRGNREVSLPLAMNIDFWVGKAGSKVAVMNLSFRDISIKRKR